MALESDSAAMAEARRIMIEGQVRPADVTNQDLIAAMEALPRELFVPKAKRPMAYIGDHLEVGSGRFELDPRIFAKLVQAADPQSTDLCLVVGSGGGYAAAVMARLCEAVIAVEESPALAEIAAAANTQCGIDNVVAVSAPAAAGCTQHQPYDVIIVCGGADADALEPLTSQLADGGRLVAIAVQGMVGRGAVWRRDAATIGRRDVFDAVAPLLQGFAPKGGFAF